LKKLHVAGFVKHSSRKALGSKQQQIVFNIFNYIKAK